MDITQYAKFRKISGNGGTGSKPVIEPLEVTANGTYTPPEGVDGYAPVSAAVHDTEVPKITDASYLFYKGVRLDSIEQLLPIIKDCTTLEYAFSYNSNLITVPVSEIPTSKCTNYNRLFAYCGKLTTSPIMDTGQGKYFETTFEQCKELVTIPYLNTKNAVTLYGIFDGCEKLKNLPEGFDASNAGNVSYMCRFCKSLTYAPELNTHRGGTFSYIFYGCVNLVTVSRLDMNNSSRNTANMFNNCYKLENLYLYNISSNIQIGSGTTWGHLLTVDSLVNTIKELCTVTTTQTLTMGSANLEKISGLYCKITDDTNEKLTMELCESTDEGAMTLDQYAAEKGWLLK